jgi:uncharacterized repeat protein (TIGR03943 family)
VLFLLPALVFGIWGCLLFRLHLSQELANLQSPRFHLYTLTAAAFLLLLSILHPLLFIPSPSAPAPSFPSLAKKCLSILWLLLPAGAYLMLPPAFTTPAALLDRAWSSASNGSGVSARGRVDPEAVRAFILNSDPHVPLSLSPVDLLVVQGEKELQEVLKDRQVEVLGQWMQLEEKDPLEFRLVRLLMVCCAADARPIGLMTLGSAEGAEPGAWFKVTGTLIFDDPRETVVLKAEEIDPVEAPEEIFLY